MAEHDGVDEALSNSLRTALMAAGQIGAQLARVRENQLRHAEASSAQAARELQSRLDVERLAARAELAVVNRNEWWDAASADDITGAWQTANAWRMLDPDVERAASRIESEVAARWGLDARETGARPDQVREQLQRILEAHAAAKDERAQAKRAEAEAIELLLLADGMRDSRDPEILDDVAADEEKEDGLRRQARELNDSAAAHHDSADEYLAIADSEIRDAKMSADKGQAWPASRATSNAGKKARRVSRPGADQAQEHAISR